MFPGTAAHATCEENARERVVVRNACGDSRCEKRAGMICETEQFPFRGNARETSTQVSREEGGRDGVGGRDEDGVGDGGRFDG